MAERRARYALPAAGTAALAVLLACVLAGHPASRAQETSTNAPIALPALPAPPVQPVAPSQPAQATEPAETPAQAPANFGDSPYRLGAGDVLKIQLYGVPDTIRPEVTVAPDGTISYLSVVELSRCAACD